LPAESDDELLLFSISLHETRNGRGQCCSSYGLNEVLIAPRDDRTIILAMAKESIFLRNEQRALLAKGSPQLNHNRGRKTRL
jgi:hypothetical protein